MGDSVLEINILGPYRRPDGRNRTKACISNQRVILGAVEMYNMDNDEKMDVLDIDLLIKGRYLKSYPTKPEKECSYSAIGLSSYFKSDLDENAADNALEAISCPVHGNAKQYNTALIEAKKEKEYKQRRGFIILGAIIIGIILI